ncbi:UDP-N-acetyl-D-mannosaminuronic acid dehydrogenase [Actinomadura cremea]|nr:UDP-N-acetyl-D-mannosaminuronic acid dehydrogenase [Actinomadura cremea]
MPDNQPDSGTVAVVGLGYVGSCLAAALAERGLNVLGIDTDEQLIDEYKAGFCRFREDMLADGIARALAAGRLHLTTDHRAVSAAGVVLIAVGTPVHADGSLADEQLRAACGALGEHLRPGQLAVLKSTVPPGTTRELVRPLLEQGGLRAGRDFRLAFSPERLAEGTALTELRSFPIVVGGIDARSTAEAAEFWRRGLGVETVPQESLEAAELVKLADNWWIDLNIALANELARLCALYGADVLDVIEAANTVPKGNGRVNILLPGVGVGGSCLTKDPWMVWHAARLRGLELHTPRAGRAANSAMPEYTAQLIIDDLVERGKDPAESTVAVLGLAFKNDTGDLRATPTQGVIAALTKAGVRVRCHDPLVDADAAEDLLNVRPLPTVEETVRDADCLAVLAHHRAFDAIEYAALEPAGSCLILDGRDHFPKDKVAKLRELGYRYRGIGR